MAVQSSGGTGALQFEGCRLDSASMQCRSRPAGLNRPELHVDPAPRQAPASLTPPLRRRNNHVVPRHRKTFLNLMNATKQWRSGLLSVPSTGTLVLTARHHRRASSRRLTCNGFIYRFRRTDGRMGRFVSRPTREPASGLLFCRHNGNSDMPRVRPDNQCGRTPRPWSADGGPAMRLNWHALNAMLNDSTTTKAASRS